MKMSASKTSLLIALSVLAAGNIAAAQVPNLTPAAHESSVPPIPTRGPTPTPSEWDGPGRVASGGATDAAGGPAPLARDISAPATFEPLSQDQYDVFLDSIRSRTPLRLPPTKSSQLVDSATSGVWAGSKERVDSLGSQLVLRFRRKLSELVNPSLAGDVSGGKLLESWDLFLDVRDGWMFLKHGAPALARDINGFRAKIDSTKYGTRTPFMRGGRDSHLYVGIPPYSDYATTWGVMICPRRLVKEGVSGVGIPEYVLGPSPYELSEVSFDFQMRGETSMSTAGQEGRARMWLQTSANLPPGLYNADESVSSIPKVSVYYKPREKVDFFRFAPFDEIQEGALLTSEMHNKAGYRRRHMFAHVLHAKKVSEPFPIKVIAEGKRVVRDEGDCYVVVMDKYSWMQYDKQPADF